MDLMKTEYPVYKETGTAFIEDKLNKNPEDKKALEDFLKMCSVTSNKARVNNKIKPEMLKFFDIIGNLTKWNKEVVQDFLVLVKNSDKAEWTKNDIKRILKRFIKFHYEYLPEKELKKMTEMIKTKSELNSFNFERVNESTIIDIEEFEKMLRSCNTLKQKAILSVLFETGCRPQELRMLKWSDINLED